MKVQLWKEAAASLILLLGTGGSSAWAEGPAPAIGDLANATYPDEEGVGGPVKLTDGEWLGEPWVEGGASVPSAALIGDLVVHADLDLDGRTESFNLIWFSGGGTGRFSYLAASRFEGDAVEVFAMAPLGDRVMVRDMRAEQGLIAIDLVQAGPEDGACCPADVVTRRWRLQEDGLAELPLTDVPRRLSAAVLADSEWRLSRWAHDEPVDEDMAISLAFADGKFTGRSACNRYFAGVTDTEGSPGTLEVSGVGSTRMACVDERHAAAEARFLAALEDVNRIAFMAGEMVLYWGEGTDFGGLFFKPVKSAEE